MADEKQLSAIRFFCRKRKSDRRSKQPKGRDYHDWGDLVQQISYFDFGHIQKDDALVQTVARSARKEYPDGQNWMTLVNAPGSHERILSGVRSSFASLGAA